MINPYRWFFNLIGLIRAPEVYPRFVPKRWPDGKARLSSVLRRRSSDTVWYHSFSTPDTLLVCFFVKDQLPVVSVERLEPGSIIDNYLSDPTQQLRDDFFIEE